MSEQKTPYGSMLHGDDEKYVIRPIKADEIELIPPLAFKEAGWTTNDTSFLKVCYEIDPRGWLVAVNHKDGIIGTVLSVNMNHAYSFSGLLLVTKAYRGKGLSKILMSKAFAHVGTRCLGVNSVKSRVSANLKMGRTQPFFKASVFNGTLDRQSKLLNFDGITKRFTTVEVPLLDQSVNSPINYQNAGNQQNSPKINQSMGIPHKTASKTWNKLFDKCKNWLCTLFGVNSKCETSQKISKPKFNPNFNPHSDKTRSADLAKYTIRLPASQKRDSIRVFNANSQSLRSIKEDTGILYLVDGKDIDFKSLITYDTGIHCHVPRENFLQTYIDMSTEKEYNGKVRCIVAKTKNISSANDVDKRVCGYGIVRPRTQPDTQKKSSKGWTYYATIGPLYADTPLIAQCLLSALCSSVPSEWDLNVEMTVPLKTVEGTEHSEVKHEASLYDSNFLYGTGTQELGLKLEVECFRMYHNTIPEKFNDGTLIRPEELMKQNPDFACDLAIEPGETFTPTISSQNSKWPNRKLVPYPNIPLDKIYCFVNPDMFLD